MTAAKPNPRLDFFAAFDALPLSQEPLTPEQEAAVEAAEIRVAAGGAGIPQAEIERQLEERRRLEDK